MPDTTPRPSSDEVLEDCLQALHRAELTGQTGSVEATAEFARVSALDAATALRELRRRGLVGDGDAEKLRLTDEGRRLAVTILRRHRLSERLLTDVLGLPRERAHDEAMRLEHVLSPEAEARLDSLLTQRQAQSPRTPSPFAEAGLPSSTTRTLDQAPVRTPVRILEVREEEPDLLHHLQSLGLLPHIEVAVEEVAPFGGPLLVRVGDARYAIGREIAAKIVVLDPAGTAGPRRARHRHRPGRASIG
jgi:DtxR family Mn-dependent transcriptional regulator